MNTNFFSAEDWKEYGAKMKDFIKKYSFLFHVNGSIVHFLQEDYWNKNLPKDWKKFFENKSIDEIYSLIKEKKLKGTPKSLDEFISNVKNLSLKLEIKNVKDEMKKVGNIKGMSQKKIHEIEKLAFVINESCNYHKNSNVLDIGCGKGHLTKVLAHQYGINVIGIDRDEKLTDYIENDEKNKEKGKLISITSNLSLDAPVEEFIKMCKLKEGCNMLTSLHSCGDLSSIMLKYYTQSNLIHSLINVGCCYHKLTEKKDSKNHGFPLSSYFDDIELGSAKNLASLLSESNIQDKHSVIENFKRNSFRSALEWILHLNSIDDMKEKCFSIGKIHSKYLDSFSNYSFYAKTKMKDQKLLKKEFLEMNEQDSKDYFEKFYEKLNPSQGIIREVAAFWTLRWILASVIESIIVIDKVLYLYENGCEVEVIKLFDSDISPRCIVILSNKVKQSNQN